MANQLAGKTASELPALKPYRGKPAVRNFRGGNGNVGIIRSRPRHCLTRQPLHGASTYKTAWFLNHRIRKAMGLADASDDAELSGTVEVDKTYMGAKKYDKRRKRGKYEKEPVFG